MALEVYKRGQGKYTRILTFIGVMAVGLIGAIVLSRELVRLPDEVWGLHIKVYLQYGIPTLVVVAIGGGMFYLMNRPGTADFLIATESEMKKVSWSTRKEVIGSTKVVIVTTFILAVVLFCVDLLFIYVFRQIGVHQL